MSKKAGSTLALLVVLAAGACNTQSRWTYPASGEPLYMSSSESSGIRVSVEPFLDERPTVNRSGTVLLYLIPLMPFGWMTYERPEAARMFNFIREYDLTLDEDLAKAAARSLSASGVFDKAFFSFGGESENADLILKGRVRELRYHGRILSYGLSILGPLLWTFGIPAGTSDNRLKLDLWLEDQQGQRVWDYSYEGEKGIVQGLYYNVGNDALGFALLMEKAMNGALADLDRSGVLAGIRR